jgi:hypothetical protein
MVRSRSGSCCLFVAPALSAALVSLLACSGPGPVEEIDSLARAPRVAVGPLSLSFEYAHPDSIIPAGIAGGREFVFVGSPIDGRVMVLSRRSGAQIAELPQPPDHLVLPLIIHAIGPSRVAVLDSGGFPSPGTVDANPTLYEYEYGTVQGNFRAHLARTVRFTGLTVGFAEEFTYLGDGQYLVPDAVYGSVWRVASDGSVHPGIVPRTFSPADAIPQMFFCRTMPQVTVGGLPFLFTASTIPGVAGIAVRDGTVYFYSSCAAGLFRFPLAALRDAREPWQRAADIQLIASKPPGVAVEELLEMQFNPFDRSDGHLYAADALALRLIRIDPHNGAREVVADDPVLFNFPASLGFLPPLGEEPSALLVLSNQQHRSPLTNDAITADVTIQPFIVTKVFIKTRPHR